MKRLVSFDGVLQCARPEGLSTLGCAMIVLLASCASVAADDVTAGNHGLTSEPITINPNIPADFFGPGSDPFASPIPLVSDPIDPWLSDTIVSRLEDAALPNCGDSATIDTEIVALSLRGEDLITVTFNGGQDPEDWMVHVDLSVEPQPLSSMAVRHYCPEGGSFDSVLRILPKFTFTATSGSGVEEYDHGLAGENPIEINSFDLGWSHTGSGPDGATNFFTAAVPPDCDCSTVPPPNEIPTVSEWGIAALALLLLIGGKVYFSRRRGQPA